MTDEEQKLIDELFATLNHDYSNTVFTARLYDMFAKKDDLIASYIKPGRTFWHYDIDKSKFRKIKVTYVRSGVMFFIFEDDPDEVERAWFTSSFNAMSLHAAEIYPYEIGELLSKRNLCTNMDIPKVCSQCKWSDMDGRIPVEVVWDGPVPTD